MIQEKNCNAESDFLTALARRGPEHCVDMGDELRKNDFVSVAGELGFSVRRSFHMIMHTANLCNCKSRC